MPHGRRVLGVVSLVVGSIALPATDAVEAIHLGWSPPPQVRQTLAAGRWHSLVIDEDGNLLAFGRNTYGQLGTATNASSNDPTSVPVQVMTEVVAVAAGCSHSLALKEDGTLWTFGYDAFGQLGDGAADTAVNSTPTQVMTNVVAISANQDYSMALKADGTLWTWGANGYGQLGNGTSTTGVTPTPAQVMTDVAGMAAGDFHAIVLTTDGKLSTFGRNQYGQLGRPANAGTNDPTPSPGQVPNLDLQLFTAVAAGQQHTLALRSDGTVFGFGYNGYGQLNSSPDTDVNSTLDVVFSGATAIAASNDQSFGLQPDGTLSAWGYNFFGQLATTTFLGQVAAIPEEDVMSGVTEVALGSTSSLILQTDGSLWTTGLNDFGQLGNGSSSSAADGTPEQILTEIQQPSSYRAIVPHRLLDTRIPIGVLSKGVRAAGSVTQLLVTGGDVAYDADAVVLNVTVAGPLAQGFITVYPCGNTRPNASNLNFTAGSTSANLVISKVGTDGKVCIYTSAAAHILADVSGFYPATSTYTALVPKRLMDSRVPASATVDGQFQGIGVRAAESTTQLTVGGRGGVPADALAVVLNVTATQPQANGFVTAYPCGSTRPNASNLNYISGATIPNLVIARIGTAQQVCLYTKSATNMIVDVAGYYPASSTFHSVVPGRFMDTRVPPSATVDGLFAGGGPKAAGSTTELEIAGRGVVPTYATAVVLNVTIASDLTTGFVTVYPCGAPRPDTSNVNFRAERTIPNLVVSKIGTDGKVCLYTSQAANIIVDVNGYYDGYVAAP